MLKQVDQGFIAMSTLKRPRQGLSNSVCSFSVSGRSSAPNPNPKNTELILMVLSLVKTRMSGRLWCTQKMPTFYSVELERNCQFPTGLHEDAMG